MRIKTFSFACSLLLVCAALWVGTSQTTFAQSLGNNERERGHQMLQAIKDDMKKHYYDAAFHGIDLEGRVRAADEKIKTATSNGQIFAVIAQVLIDLNDSHTFFLPPGRAASVEYGWQMQMIGETCYVVAVKPGSDAEAKGLKEGDIVHGINGFQVTKASLWQLNYLFRTLRPMPGMRLVVQSPDGQPRQLDILAKMKTGKRVYDLTGDGDTNDIYDLIRESENEDRLNRHRYYELGDEVMIWKMPQFDLNEGQVDDMMNKAKKRKSLILDLRGNPGGAVKTLERLTGHFFEQDVKIGDLKGRKEMKPMLAKAHGDHAYKGKIVVLVDSNSGSAAELLARVMQLGKRATVIGDRTAGAVMQSKRYNYQTGVDTVVFYGASITDADVIMSDGKSLEHVGVIPDELLLPTAADLAIKRDPVLARAAELVGIKMDPAKAGTLFPIEWQK